MRTNVFTKKKHGPAFSTIRCTICSERVAIGDAFKDVIGKYWCSIHENRGRLLNWAHENEYPAILFSGKIMRHYPVKGLPDYIAPIKYRIGVDESKDNKALWELNAFHGNEDMITAATNYIGINKLVKKEKENEEEAEG